MALTQEQMAVTPTALAGVRVVDFTWVRAGPWATRWLGALGAEVIKVEWPLNERGRTTGAPPPGIAATLNTATNFNDTNANKKGITVNLRTEKGLDLIKQLISVSDVVVENFSARALRSWGLGYEELVKLKPDIVYVSQSGFGHTGRHRSYLTMGPIAQAFSGLTFLSGLPGEPPAGWGWSYLDDTGGMYIAFSTLTSLYRRNVTGQGQHVDLSQMIVGATLNGSAMLDATVNGRPSQREGYPPGNRAHWPGTPMLKGMAALGGRDGLSQVGHFAQVRHPARPPATSRGAGPGHPRVGRDPGEVPTDGAMPGVGCARHARAKLRGPGGPRPSAPPP